VILQIASDKKFFLRWHLFCSAFVRAQASCSLSWKAECLRKTREIRT